MDFGATIFPLGPAREQVDLAVTAEGLGYSHLWFGDSHLIWREAYAVLGAVAMQTSTARLGLAVTNPITRDPTVTASATATVHELSGGRALLGIGTGDSSVMTIGRKRARLTELAAAIEQIRRLHAGERTGEAQMGWLPAPLQVPVYIGTGAFGFRLWELAGRIADGCIVSAQLSEAFIERLWENLRIGAQAAGRDLADFRVVLSLPCAVHHDGALARSWVKPAVARKLNQPLERLEFSLSKEDLARVSRLHQQYDWYQHLRSGGAHEALIPDDLVPRFCLAGTPAECREQLSGLLKLWAGRVHQISITPYTPSPQHRTEIFRHFMEEVVRPLPA